MLRGTRTFHGACLKVVDRVSARKRFPLPRITLSLLCHIIRAMLLQVGAGLVSWPPNLSSIMPTSGCLQPRFYALWSRLFRSTLASSTHHGGLRDQGDLPHHHNPIHHVDADASVSATFCHLLSFHQATLYPCHSLALWTRADTSLPIKSWALPASPRAPSAVPVYTMTRPRSKS